MYVYLIEWILKPPYLKSCVQFSRNCWNNGNSLTKKYSKSLSNK